MKKFEAPVMEIEEMEIMDVITTSVNDCVEDIPGSDCPYDTGR